MDRLKLQTTTRRLQLSNHLHSNMDRLKRSIYCLTSRQILHLHSNMDRLKRRRKGVRQRAGVIYIPIWID